MKRDLPRITLLCRVQIAISSAHREDLVAVLAACAEAPNLRPGEVEETILQGIPYSGFPGAVEALGLWRARHPDRSAHFAVESPGDDGVQVFAEVYGSRSDPVREELRDRHPVLEEWILEFAYGRVMRRRVLPLADIEALGIASLLVQRREAPLHSHLRGALRVGWDAPELIELLERLTPWLEPTTIAAAQDRVRRHAERNAGKDR